MKRNLILLLILLLISGCSLPRQAEPTPTFAPTEAPTATLAFTATLPPTGTPTPSPIPTMTPKPTATTSPTPYVPFQATVLVDNVNLRLNPGYLFESARTINRGDTFRVLGRSPGEEWMYVELPSGERGWIFTLLIDTDQDLGAAPLTQPADVQLVRGRVQDVEDNPISGIQFMITQGDSENAPRTDAMTDANGDFYAFMPANLSGEWTVAFTAIACTSNTMDENCNCKGGVCGTIEPAQFVITLPYFDPLVFDWK